MSATLDHTVLDHLKSLHTNAIDARNGYREAVEDAHGHGMTDLFQNMIALHTKNADELADALHRAGEPADEHGSFMSTVHRTVINIRSLFGGLGGSVLPGLIDGEKRNISYYQRALDIAELPPETHTLLATHRDRLQAAVATMQAIKH
jgi:uncharacterized protein (TIGR02284 family)